MPKKMTPSLDRVADTLAAMTGLRLRAAHDEQALSAPIPPFRLEERLSIPVLIETRDDTAARAAQARGQFLARQERWDELVIEIRAADLTRAATPGGTPISELMAFGARSDAVLAAEHALMEGCAPTDAALNDGIKGLEAMRRENSLEAYLALIVALAHVDLGWAWRGNGRDSTLPELNRDRCIAHFDRAADLLAPFSGVELDSPLIASAQCALLAGHRDAHLRVADDYEDLIDLDPKNYRHMRALGYHMLPRWFGSYEELDHQARRTAERTQDIWGNGGYTWVCFDAICLDENACARIDAELFIEGLHDIVAKRPEQEMINLLAAYCTGPLLQDAGDSPEADLNRMRIAGTADWLIREHLTQVHPLVWSHALDGFDNNVRVSSVKRFARRGQHFALRAIAGRFRDEINGGMHITFTPEGPRAFAS